jgi:hypothetical protein
MGMRKFTGTQHLAIEREHLPSVGVMLPSFVGMLNRHVEIAAGFGTTIRFHFDNVRFTGDYVRV